MNVAGGAEAKVGYAFGVDIDEEIMHEEVQTLDSLSVTEHVPVAYRVNMSAELFRTIPTGGKTVVGEDGVSKDSTALAQGMKEAGLMARIGNGDSAALTQALLVAKLYDAGANNAAIGEVSGVRVVSNRFSVRARQIVADNVRFVARRFKDYSELFPT
jgi:hypothetical protein